MPRYTRTKPPEDEAAPRHRAIRQLRPAIRKVRKSFAPSRHVQLNWIVAELVAAMDTGGIPPDQSEEARRLITEHALLNFLALADADAYRVRSRSITKGPSAHSARVRRTVLRHIAAAYGRPVKLDSPAQPSRRTDLPTPRQRNGLWSFVATAHMYAVTTARRNSLIRLAAVIGITLDTGARSGENAAAQISDLSEDLWTITLSIRPQGVGNDEPTRTAFRLSEKTRNALTYWLKVRTELTSRHEGGEVHALWVTVRAGGWSGRATPDRQIRPVHIVGMPLSRSALTSEYARAVRWLNTHRYDDPTWEPIPGTIERLRMTSDPVIVPPHREPSGTLDPAPDHPPHQRIDRPGDHP